MTDDAEHIVGLYQRHADAFRRARERGPFAERAWLDRFVDRLPAGASVLDIGCGCGVPMAGYLIEQGVKLCGVDSSERMIELCRSRFPQQSWRVADMRELDLGRRFDGLLAWDSFFHLDHAHQQDMFARFARHARPGAPLLFNTGAAHGTATGCMQGEALYHASLAPDAYAELLDRHGFSVLDRVVEDRACGGRTVWLAQREA